MPASDVACGQCFFQTNQPQQGVAHAALRVRVRACARAIRQEALKQLRSELATSLADVEAQLEALGGSASTVSRATAKTVKSTATAKSLVPPSTIDEADES